MMKNILTTLVTNHAAATPDREAYSVPTLPDGKWVPTTWAELKRRVSNLANAFIDLGFAEADRIALFTQNRGEVLVCDFAAYACRMSPISIYATSSLDQVVFIVNDCEARMLMVGDEAQLAIALKAVEQCPSLMYIVLLDESTPKPAAAPCPVVYITELESKGSQCSEEIAREVERRTASATPDDIATIIYTSGTTGTPKGAVLPHSCFTAALDIHQKYLTTLSDRDTSLCFLPLSHIFEKAWTYLCLYMGIRVSINIDPHAIQRTITERRPTCMCSVPRFWEKVYTTIQTKLTTIRGPRKWVLNKAIAIGRRRNLKYRRMDLKAPWYLEMAYQFFYRQVLRPVQKLIGVENGNMYPTAGAPLSPVITEFFLSIGIPIKIGYGLSETTATVSCYPEYGYEIGSVGTPIPRVNVRIGDNNEIQVKAPTVMREYYRNPEATAEAFTPDGWLRTGDAGLIDQTGALILTERIKDLFKTSNGKYIAPQAIESRLGEDPMIEQVALIGDQHKYVSALIVPSYPALKKYAEEHHIDYYSTDDLVKNVKIHDMMARRIEKLQAPLASYERIKKFVLLPQEFTMENGELTNTLKIKRPVIYRRYANEIASMYD